MQVTYSDFERSLITMKRYYAQQRQTLVAYRQELREKETQLQDIAFEQSMEMEQAFKEKREQLAILKQTPPARDKSGDQARQAVLHLRPLSETEQVIAAKKGNTWNRITSLNRSVAMVRSIDIRSLRQQAYREWEMDCRMVQTDIVRLEQSRLRPYETEEQRSLRTDVSNLKRAILPLQQQVDRLAIEIEEREAQVLQANLTAQTKATQDALQQQATADRAAEASIRRQLAEGLYTRQIDEEKARIQIRDAEIAAALDRREAARLALQYAQQRATSGTPPTNSASTQP